MLLALLGAGAAVPAGAQERYRLGDDGWAKVAAPEPGTPRGDLQAIRKLLAEERPKEALQKADAWIEAHPGHGYMPEALLLRGDARVGLGDYWNALYDYEQLIVEWPASAEYLTAVEREYRVAQVFMNGWKRKLLGIRLLPTDGEGEELLIRVQERAPGTAIGEKASADLADYYFGRQQMVLAAEAYGLFLDNYPDSPRREWAMLRLIQANLAQFKGPQYDGTGLIEASERLDLYAREFPAAAERIGVAALQHRIRTSLAQRDLASARWYDVRGDRVATVSVYRRLIHDYPDTTAAREAIAWLTAHGEAVAVSSE